MIDNWKLTLKTINAKDIYPNLGSWYDLDVNEEGEWLAAFQAKKDKLGLFVYGKSIELPYSFSFPIVRFLRDNLALVVNARVSKKDDINALIMDLSEKKVLKEFNVGDGVKDVVILDDYIAISYFDEGIFGNVSPSEVGVAIFDHAGEYLYGYLSSVDKPVDIADCYALTKTGKNNIAFFPYSEFEVVRFNIENKTQEVFETPKTLHGSGAMTLVDDTVFLRGPYGDKSDRSSVFAYNLGTRNVLKVGKIEGKFCRGLQGGRFLLRNEDKMLGDKVSIVSVSKGYK